MRIQAHQRHSVCPFCAVIHKDFTPAESGLGEVFAAVAGVAGLLLVT